MMASPATLNHFPAPSVAPVNSISPIRTIPFPCSALNVGTSLPSILISRTTRRMRICISHPRLFDSTATADNLSAVAAAASSSGAVAVSLSSEEEAGEAPEPKIGAKVRVKVPLKVYHVPKVPEIELNGMEGTLKQYVVEWKGKKISANLPFKVQFFKDIDGRTVKIVAHLKEDEFEYID